MVDLTDTAIDAALERGRAAHANEPRAAAARSSWASASATRRCASTPADLPASLMLPPVAAQGATR